MSESRVNNMRVVTGCLLIIGDEILSGRTQDKNLVILSRRLSPCGVQLTHVRVISDDEGVIISTLNEVRNSYDYVFTTGGIGPTHDDITSETVAKALGLDWVVHAEAYDILSESYRASGIEFNESRMRMAKTPVGAELLYNPISFAPGFRIENIFVMAGVPAIMESMLDTVLPMLEGGFIIHSCALECDLGEGVIAETLSGLQSEYSEVSIGSYPIFGADKFSIHIVMRSVDESLLAELYDRLFIIIEGMGGLPRKCDKV